MKMPLTLKADGTFTIVQFTDVHWKNGEPEDLLSEALMEAVLAAEKPDLVFFTGDLIRAEFCADPRASYRRAVQSVERAGVPWALVFGNHDDEGTATRSELLEVQQESPLCLTMRGPEDIDGVGNFVLEVTDPRDGSPAAALYGFDSGGNAQHPLGGYDWVRLSQIAWYREQARARTGPDGRPLPSLAFLHIPFPEYNDVWNYRICYGSKYEHVGCPKLNSGLFAALMESGGVLGVFAGHDHINDYWGELHGIRLCYGRATGYNTYGRDGFPRGARIIRLDPGRNSFDSWLRLDDGSAVLQQPPHAPAVPNADPFIEVAL